MKKTVLILAILAILLGIFTFTNKVYATEKAIDEQTESQLVEIKETQTKSLKDYQEKYGSDTYGLVAYILNIIRIGYTRKIKNDAKDPKTIGIDKNKIIVALYTGCLTTPYNAVSTTF